MSPLLTGRQGELDPTKAAEERPYDMPEDEAFLRPGLPGDEKERQLAM